MSQIGAIPETGSRGSALLQSIPEDEVECDSHNLPQAFIVDAGGIFCVTCHLGHTVIRLVEQTTLSTKVPDSEVSTTRVKQLMDLRTSLPTSKCYL